jgi:hypothetical protein
MSQEDTEQKFIEGILSFLNTASDDVAERLPEHVVREFRGQMIRDLHSIMYEFIDKFRELYTGYMETTPLKGEDAMKMYYSVLATCMSTFLMSVAPPSHQPFVIKTFVRTHLRILEQGVKLAGLMHK